MGSSIAELIAAIQSAHRFVPAFADAAARLGRLAEAIECEVPEDLREFYLRFNSVSLFDRYLFMPVDGWMPTGAALQGSEWATSEPASWYALCDVFDGNYVGMDFKPNVVGDNLVFYCDHDDISQRWVIARSFGDFVERALGSRDALYFFESGFEQLDMLHVPHNPPLSWLRREYQSWAVDPEVGPETCRRPDCARLHVALSVLCRRHHFENIHRLPYPFDD